MSISKENELSPMFEWTWKLSHLIKTKFIENEKRVLKKKTSKKKKKKKKKKLVSDEIWTCAFGRKTQRKIIVITHSATLKTGSYSISKIIESFQE